MIVCRCSELTYISQAGRFPYFKGQANLFHLAIAKLIKSMKFSYLCETAIFTIFENGMCFVNPIEI